MKMLRTVVATAFMGMAFMSCNDIQSMAQKAQKELGVPVQVLTRADDACVLQQFNRSYNEYKALTSDAQANLRNEIKAKYQSVTFNSTVNVGSVNHQTF